MRFVLHLCVVFTLTGCGLVPFTPKAKIGSSYRSVRVASTIGSSSELSQARMSIFNPEENPEAIYVRVVAPDDEGAAEPNSNGYTRSITRRIREEKLNFEFTVDFTQFVASSPENVIEISSDQNALDLGSITISDLEDNALDICGEASNERCQSAHLGVYTFGQRLPGICSPEPLPAVAIPLLSQIETLEEKIVGLGFENATEHFSYQIPRHKKKIKLNNFAHSFRRENPDLHLSGNELPPIQLYGNLESIPEGLYSTTLVVAYWLE